MRRTRLAILAALPIVLATLGCDTTQPDQVTVASATLIVAAQAKVDNNDCWEVWVDTDDNGVPDENSGQIWCQPVGEEQKVQRPVPWRYSISVSLLRAGTTTAEVVASSVIPGDAIPDFVSLTPYDETPLSIGSTRVDEPPLYFQNPVRCSNGSPYWLAANGYDPGIPNVIEQIPTYDFTMNPGDTVIVQAIKQSISESPGFLPTDEDPELHITGILTVSGVQVSLEGQPVSPNTDLTGISFSYTRR